MELQPETILHERYRIIEKLGQGGMGAVYLAWDETLETRVAVKSNFNPAPESVDQFLKEAQLLAGLKHQNLPRVTDYFVIDKEQYLVMDYIAGEDLGERLKREGSQKPADVLRWSAQLCDALSYMHGQNPPVTHRDIKPANIKITPDGDAILVDFGIAKVDSVQAHTAAGASGYTPGFAPPEQYGQGRTGPYSDQFSLAATVYALLTRVKPADSIQRILGKAELQPIHDLDPNLSLNINDAILKAMSLEASDRFPSIQTFQEALEDPGYRMGDQERERITSQASQKTAVGDINAVQSADPTVLGAEIKKKRTRNTLILAIGGGLAGICLLVAAVLVLALPKSPLYLPAMLQRAGNPTATNAPTTTETLLQIEYTETPELVRDTPAPLSTSPLIEAATATSTPELVGESGLIAFASDRGEDGLIQIWTMKVYRDPQGEISTDSFTQLTFDEGDKDQPVWSPDGTKIAYVAPGEGENGLDIWVMDADGSNQKNISSYRGDEFDPVWTPDGNLITFTHHLRDDGGNPVYALTWIQPDGTGRERLSLDFVEYAPTFSPDGLWMLYVISARSHDFFYFRSASDGFDEPRGFDLRSILGEFGEVSSPAWAPSGNQFAYTELRGSKQYIVLVTYVTIQANGVHQPKEYILTDTGEDTDVAWSPDARWLAFTSTRDGDPDIYLMPTTGRPQVNLTSRVGVDRSPDWFPLTGDE